MRKRVPAGRTGWVAGLVLMAGPGVAAAQLRLVPFDVRVPAAPIPVLADGQARLVYELRITNLGGTDLALTRIDVLAGQGGPALARWEADSLKALLRRIAPAGDSSDARVIRGGRQTVAYLLVSVAPGSVPATLTHRLVVAHPDSMAGPPRDSLTGVPVTVRQMTLPVLQSPFEAGVWLASNGPGNTSGHRRTAIPLDGVARIAQRYATDWLEIGPDGRLFQGDSTRNESWYGYGKPLLAVAAGTVVATLDGVADNVPLSPQRAVALTLENVGGNHVILDIGGGFYAFYAHLKPGSVRVKRGDRVQAGQPIGLLGNSGNSDAPHLHLHLGDAPSPLATEGLPFVFDRFEWLDRVTSAFELGIPWKAQGAPQTRRRELPLENDVVRFR